MTLKYYNLNYFMIPYLFYFIYMQLTGALGIYHLLRILTKSKVKTDIHKTRLHSLFLSEYSYNKNNYYYNENIQNPHL